MSATYHDILLLGVMDNEWRQLHVASAAEVALDMGNGIRAPCAYRIVAGEPLGIDTHGRLGALDFDFPELLLDSRGAGVKGGHVLCYGGVLLLEGVLPGLHFAARAIAVFHQDEFLVFEAGDLLLDSHDLVLHRPELFVRLEFHLLLTELGDSVPARPDFDLELLDLDLFRLELLLGLSKEPAVFLESFLLARLPGGDIAQLLLHLPDAGIAFLYDEKLLDLVQVCGPSVVLSYE